MTTNIPGLLMNNGVPIVPGLGDPTVGNVYYVNQNTDLAWYTQWYEDHHRTYSDGTVSTYTTIQGALDACQADRNDYVVVTPDSTTYTIAAGLTMSKALVHLICPAGISPYCGASNAARIICTAAEDWLTITADKVEVAGLFIRPAVHQDGIYLSGSRLCCRIHHNSIMSSLTDNATMYSIYSDGVCQFNEIFSNYIIIGYNCAASNKTVPAIISFSSGSGGRNIVANNILCTGRFTTVTDGVVLSGLMNMLIGNHFYETTAGDTTRGIFTEAWHTGTDTYIADNRLGMSTPATTGGVVHVTNVLNYSSTNGGALIAAD